MTLDSPIGPLSIATDERGRLTQIHFGERDLEMDPLAMQVHSLLHEAADANYAIPPQAGEDVLGDAGDAGENG